jgi:hypothetical protein
MGDPGRDHAGLPGARARQDQERTLGGRDGFPLGGIQGGEES